MVAVNVTACPNTVLGVFDSMVGVVPEWKTSWFNVSDVEGSNPAEPENAAVMLWAARLSDDVVNVAVPATTPTVPRGVAPSKKVTDPPAGVGLTVAVNVMVCPNIAGVV